LSLVWDTCAERLPPPPPNRVGGGRFEQRL
jgi:hypothetical protein